jgi:hypothetical protein
LDDLNFSVHSARTDAQGRFSFQPPHPPRVYFLYAAAPRYGKLLQTTFGQTVVMYRNGQQVRNVMIPAIPATEVSGHVYGSDGKPLAGCFVSAITRTSKVDFAANLQIRGFEALQAGDSAESDDPKKLMDVENEETDANGMYVFHSLGADRYFILARCKKLPTVNTIPPSSWEPMLYPQAHSFDESKEIVLLPGERRKGIDFHIQRKRTYNLEGDVLFSNHLPPKPWPQAIYSQDLVVLRSDRALGSTWLGRESCEIDANAGSFRCNSLLPGEYTFYFQIASGLGAASDLPTQAASVRYKIPPVVKQSLVVQLNDVPEGGVRCQVPYTGPGGNLELREVCAAARDGQPAIEVLAWGRGHAGGACYWMTFHNTIFHGGTRLFLPKDYYTVNAYEAAFVRRERSSYLGNSSKFEAVLMQRGTRIQVDVGQTSQPQLPVLRTSELINIALTSLQADPEPR